ncbi:hypothetical protein N8766_02245 [bacterium]|nr:hypothetical protein [Verrucomicrobiota bacterium]MDA7632905.1 hypothetical protein [bacterium]MDA7866475.1 hypothetical protein [Verrucomicrobiota bacterium]
MNNQISTKNLVIGFALGVIVTASLGAALKSNNEVGRFQITANPNQAYIVDTLTGQAWSTGRIHPEFSKPRIDQKSF